MAGVQESAACQAALVNSFEFRRKSIRIRYAAGISPEYFECYTRVAPLYQWQGGEATPSKLKSPRIEPFTFCRGYLRSICFTVDFAIVDLSKPCENETFTGLALDDDLAKADSEPRCALIVIDLKTGDIVHWLRMEGVVEELYDVVALSGVVCPMALGFKTDEIRRTISVGEESPLYAN